MTYFSQERVGDVWVMHLKGEVWGDWGIVELKDTVADLVEDGGSKFVIDLGPTNYVTSNGIGVLVAVMAMLKKTDARLKLCDVSERSRRALRVTGVWPLFEAHRDQTEALRAFGAVRPTGQAPASDLQAAPRIR